MMTGTQSFIVVGCGGFVGSALRHAVNLAATALGYATPAGTLLVNVVGCGIAGAALAHFEGTSSSARIFLVTGILGGFTTFSAFSVDTLTMMRANAYRDASLYFTASVLLSLAAAGIGFYLYRRLL